MQRFPRAPGKGGKNSVKIKQRGTIHLITNRINPKPRTEYAPRRQAPAVPGIRSTQQTAAVNRIHSHNKSDTHRTRPQQALRPDSTQNTPATTPNCTQNRPRHWAPGRTQKTPHATDPDTHTIIGPAVPGTAHNSTQKTPHREPRHTQNTPAQQEPNRARTRNMPTPLLPNTHRTRANR